MRKYLVVDDNRAFAENVAEILRDQGADVTIADGGLQALELAQRSRFDALVTDMRMPVMSGARLVHDLHGESNAILERAAPFVVTKISLWRDELIDQVALGPHDLDTVIARALR